MAASYIAPIRTVDHTKAYSSFPEQAPIAGDYLIYLTQFSSPYVINLGGTHFSLGNEKVEERVSIIWKNCMLVLFYGENQESKDLMRIFAAAAVQAPGVKFGACNLLIDDEVAKAWKQLEGTANPLSQMSMKGYPFIIVYQGGYPVGEVDIATRSEVSSLVNFAISTACGSTFHPRTSHTIGVQTEANWAMVEPRAGAAPASAPAGTTSGPASPGAGAATPLRYYDPNIGLVYQGSDKEAEARRVVDGGAPTETRAPIGRAVPPAVSQR